MPEIDPDSRLPVGDRVNSRAAQRPGRITIPGRYVTLVPLEAEAHGPALWEATGGVANSGVWQYLFDGPFTNYEDFHSVLQKKAAGEDPLFFAILEHQSGRASGYASLMRVEPVHRSIEVGSILFAPSLQRTRGATEAMYLMARHAFEELGYRRYEWKCDALNEGSRRAALRLGFQFEGIFRQHMIIKGRNRDTAWFSMLDSEWPQRKQALQDWLDPANFDEQGTQLTVLAR